MFPGVDLHLQPEGKRRRILRLESIEEGDSTFLEGSPRLTEPRVQSRAKAIDSRADRFGGLLDEVDALGVARAWSQMKLVERSSTAKGERFGQLLVLEDLDQRAMDDEILLDLEALDPGRMASPLGDEVGRDHRSGSRSALTQSFQRSSRRADDISALGIIGAVSVARAVTKLASRSP